MLKLHEVTNWNLACDLAAELTEKNVTSNPEGTANQCFLSGWTNAADMIDAGQLDPNDTERVLYFVMYEVENMYPGLSTGSAQVVHLNIQSARGFRHRVDELLIEKNLPAERREEQGTYGKTYWTLTLDTQSEVFVLAEKLSHDGIDLTLNVNHSGRKASIYLC